MFLIDKKRNIEECLNTTNNQPKLPEQRDRLELALLLIQNISTSLKS